DDSTGGGSWSGRRRGGCREGRRSPPGVRRPRPHPGSHPRTVPRGRPCGRAPPPPGRPPAEKPVPAGPEPKPPAAKPPPPPVAQGLDPHRTSVDFPTPGALVEDQQKAQQMFEQQLAPAATEVEPGGNKPKPNPPAPTRRAAAQR